MQRLSMAEKHREGGREAGREGGSRDIGALGCFVSQSFTDSALLLLSLYNPRGLPTTAPLPGFIF